MNVPALRFPEFEREWEAINLAKLVDEKRKITYGIVQPGKFVDEGVYLVRGGDYSNGWSPREAFKKVTAEIDRPYRRSKLKAGDLLITIVGANTGNVATVPDWLEDANITQTTARIAVEKINAIPQFIEKILGSRKGQREVYKYIKGAAQPGLNISDLDKFQLTVPSLPEQKKIAAFLGVVDAKIAALRARVAGLERYKRGLMQALFSQTLRFTKPDGSAFPDWEEKRLGEYLELSRLRVKATTNIPVYSSARDGLKPQKDYFADRELSNEGEYGVVPPGLIVYRHMSDDLTFKFNLNDLGHEIAVSKEYPVFGTTGMDVRYLRLWLNNSDEFARFAAMQKLGGTRTRLYFKTLQSWRVSIPHLDEQAKIAEALSAMDAKIAAVSGQLDLMQDFKKGLLQQMFV